MPGGMLSKNQIKYIRSLHLAKFRRQEKLFIAEGPKLALELLNSDFRVHSIHCLEEWHRANNRLCGDIPVSIISQKELERISNLQTPNEVLLLVKMMEEKGEAPTPGGDLVLVLDGIRDPGNLGTIIRTADWYGVRDVICSGDCVEVYNPKVVQATMGSIARVRVSYRDLKTFFASQGKDLPVYGTLLDGRSLYDQELSASGYLLIGSESHGISASLMPFITHPLLIPPHSKAGAESLNASVATAIVLAEFRRRSKL